VSDRPVSRSIFVVAGALLTAQEVTKDPPANQVLAPPPNALFQKGPVRVIARTDGNTELLLDGKKVTVESPHAGVLTAEVTVESGVHEVTVGDSRAKFAVGDAPGEWKAFRQHPPVSQCTTCHAVRNGNWRFVRASLASVCSACHNKEKFPEKHTHEMGILTDCQMCHDSHGSTAAGHLKMSRANACKLCHNLQ